MQLARGGSAYHYRGVQTCRAQRLGHIDHFFKAGRNQSAKANDVHLLLYGFLYDFFGRNHNAHIDNLVIVASHDDCHDILTNVVNIALDCGQQHLAGFRRVARLLRLDIGIEYCHRLLHRAGCLHHLREEHLALAEQVAHDIHAGHKRSFDDVYGMWIRLYGLVQVFLKICAYALDQSIFQSFLKTLVSPLVNNFLAAVGWRSLFLLLLLLAYLLREFYQALGSICRLVENDAFDYLEMVFRNIGIENARGGVDDTEIHSVVDGMIQEHGVHRLADVVVAAERETEVAHATADVNRRQVVPYPFCGSDKVETV